MKIAFYKGTRSGVAGAYSIGVRKMTKGKYSHVELIFSDGVSASSTYSDGGVRFKAIIYDPDKWDIFYLPSELEDKAYRWFKKHEGQKYDILGNVFFAVPLVGDSDSRWSCAEAVAEAICIKDSWRFHPNLLAAVILTFINKGSNMNALYVSPDDLTPTPDEPVEDTGGDTLPKKPPK